MAGPGVGVDEVRANQARNSRNAKLLCRAIGIQRPTEWFKEPSSRSSDKKTGLNQVKSLPIEFNDNCFRVG